MNQLKEDILDHFYIKGGQIVSQALAAALLTVPSNFNIHSLHSYFLLAGKYESSASYQVERLRDGKTFATRIVRAKQDNETIFTMTCSFQADQPYITQHQYCIPPVYPPEHGDHPIYVHTDGQLPKVSNIGPSMNVSIFDKIKLFSRAAIHKDQNLQKLLGFAFDHQLPKHVSQASKSSIIPPYSLRWFKVDANIAKDSKLQYLYIALISDFWSPLHVSTPYFYGVNSGKVARTMVATIDHSVWFHESCDVTEWLLFEATSSMVSNNRILINARLYSQDGRHVASFQQENVFRIESACENVTTSFNFLLPHLESKEKNTKIYKSNNNTHCDKHSKKNPDCHISKL
ncbi:hypothetical protein BB561_006821 [Smittium simulii]|uniref:Acyl-CoA thioesterase II n=1 Tax=Smittium simulii TaxID=133385 RepID=A0A2T9Y181_9FUNG|nr:hypothetical protein BB561_006821 [Smittium simulii]